MNDQDGEYAIDENSDGTPDYKFAKPDFNVGQFRSNMVVRWEYIPGIYVFPGVESGYESAIFMSNRVHSRNDMSSISPIRRTTFLCSNIPIVLSFDVLRCWGSRC